MAKEVSVVPATPLVINTEGADSAATVAASVKDLPWRCAPCWKAGKDVQLEDKKQPDPTGRIQCPEGHSHWGKTGLDD